MSSVLQPEQAVGAIQDSDSFRAYLDVQVGFHRYCFGNVALSLTQRPDTAMVAGFNTWLTLTYRSGKHRCMAVELDWEEVTHERDRIQAQKYADTPNGR